MTLRDQLHYAAGNLVRTRLRTFLTSFGVAIGIGAMTSMVSVGTGMQRNVVGVFNQENVLTSITVMPASPSARPPSGSEPGFGPDMPAREPGFDPDMPAREPGFDPDLPAHEPAVLDSFPTLDDAAVREMARIEGVRFAYPVATVPGLLILDDHRRFVTLEAMPPGILAEDVSRERVTLVAGRVYAEGETDGIVLSLRTAESLLPPEGSPETLTGRKITFIVAQASEPGEAGPEQTFGLPEGLDLPPALRALPLAGLLQGLPGGNVASIRLELEVVGIVEGSSTFGDFLGTAVYIPLAVIQPLSGRAFPSLQSVLRGHTGGEGYARVQVVARDILSVERVQAEIEAMGYRSASILDQLSDLRRGFLLMNGFLATIGGVSLFVATMMIINTLVMAVLERRREIGLLKSLGASNGDVVRLFLTEASVIGALGGVGGLLLGYLVARITSALANAQAVRAGATGLDLVAFPIWLILGAMALAVAVSVAAGLYPARRAARVDPVVALRQF